MLAVVTALYWVADRLDWPASAALIVAGGALAFVPGIPFVSLDPELVLVLFLPPLLADGAWNTELVSFRRYLPGIMSLAIGAVVFSTIVVAVVAHWLIPAMPWGACAALGAIVSPPDAISAKAILARVSLPRKLNALLEGESLMNDATGLVILRFAIAAVVGSAFDPGAAAGRFALLTLGGAGVGFAIGWLWTFIARRLASEIVVIVTTALVGWIAYLSGEAVGVSGVIAAVTAGLVMGWEQHVVLPASTRIRATSFWQVMIFLLEASVFVLIGFSLRDVVVRGAGLAALTGKLLGPLAVIILALTAARFIWVFASDGVIALLHRLSISRERAMGAASCTVVSWAGMRGVVTLAAALTLPVGFPFRDFILMAAFGVILVTVLIQGTTLGAIIRLLGVRRTADDVAPLDLYAAEQAMMKAQLTAVETLARDEHGTVIHPQLLRRYTARAAVGEAFTGTAAGRDRAIAAHFDVIIRAVTAGRGELLRLHRRHMIDDETLRSLEHDLDLEELSAEAAKG